MIMCPSCKSNGAHQFLVNHSEGQFVTPSMVLCVCLECGTVFVPQEQLKEIQEKTK